MTATVFYDNLNEIALVSNSFFNSSGALADPTTVACVITDAAGVSVTHTYAGASPFDIIKLATGKYTLSVPCSPSAAGADGLWGYEWVGTGSVSDVQPGTWRVLPEKISQLWYIGLEEFKDRLGITDSADDSQAQIAIQSASGWINDFCGRHFNRITETRTYQPRNIWMLDVDDLISVTSVRLDMDGDGVYELALTQNTDYQLRLGTGQYNPNARGTPAARPYRQIQIIQTGNWLPFTWPFTRLDRVQVTGTWGWPQVPPQVAQAAFLLAADLFKMKDAPFGLSGSSDLGMMRIQSNPWLVEMLRPFISSRHKVGV